MWECTNKTEVHKMIFDICESPIQRCKYIAGPFFSVYIAEKFIDGYLRGYQQACIDIKENHTPVIENEITVVDIKKVILNSDLIGFEKIIEQKLDGYVVANRKKLSVEETQTLIKERIVLKAHRDIEEAEKQLERARRILIDANK